SRAPGCCRPGAGTVHVMQADPPAQVLDGRYEVGARIGSGGMGEVRRGVDRRLGRDVAIKFLRPDLAEQPAVRGRFEHEAQVAARLSHASAVTVFDSGEDDGVPYLVMECLPGRTLADALSEGPLPEDQVRELAVDLLGALGAAHALGIVHRDVKPGNILFTNEGRVKLADFGIAKSADLVDQTMAGQLVGTPAYLAPERLRGEEASPSTDLYSLGVVLYEALVGRKPFVGDTPIALAYAIDNSSPPPVQAQLPAIDAVLGEAIHRALAKDPAVRFPDAGSMARVISGEGLATRSGEATVAASPMATEVFPAAAAPAGAPQANALTTARTWWDGQPATNRRYYAAATAVAVLLLAALLLSGRGGGGEQPAGQTTTTAPSTVATVAPPPALDDALRKLEDAVKP
ncbi:MAG: serine/threonine protein kinase, partial [Actinomycetia bacterium]|nr:serine/threonine protein kinase [Actinomycetes bacterium]